MTFDEMEVAKKKVQRETLNICLDLPFYGGILMSLQNGVIMDEDCETAWTDGRSIGFGYKLAMQLSPYGIKFVIIHEIFHIALKHHLRGEGRVHDKWNRAADYVIHDNMEEDGYRILDWVLYDPQYAGMTTEMVYGLLDDDPSSDSCQGSGGSGTTSGDKPELGNGGSTGSFDEVRPMKNEDGSAMTESEKAVEAQSVDITVAQAFTAAKAAGTGTPAQERLCKDLLEPKVDWRNELRMYLEEHARNDYTWTRPNRRYISTGLYMPSLYSEEMQDMVFFMDTSCSVSEKELQQYMSEVADILNIFSVRIWVVYVDTKVHSPQEFNSQEFWKIDQFKPEGFGGTDFRPGFEWVEEQGIRPAVAVYLTDFECDDFPETAPDYDVIWCITSPYYKNAPAPFGRKIIIDEW